MAILLQTDLVTVRHLESRDLAALGIEKRGAAGKRGDGARGEQGRGSGEGPSGERAIERWQHSLHGSDSKGGRFLKQTRCPRGVHAMPFGGAETVVKS